jgi:hypothetical protein
VAVWALAWRCAISHTLCVFRARVAYSSTRIPTPRCRGQILATLAHPNIVAYYGSFMSGEDLNVVMEYADRCVPHRRSAIYPSKVVVGQLSRAVWSMICTGMRGRLMAHRCLPESKLNHRVLDHCGASTLTTGWYERGRFRLNWEPLV